MSMRMSVRWISAVLVVCIVAMETMWAQASPVVSVPDLLRAITTEVSFQNRVTGRSNRCAGFVTTVRDPNAYVATATECVADVLSTPLTTGVPFSRLNVDITVEYADGSVGAVRGLAWLDDTVVLAASFLKRPQSYNRLCPSCVVYADLGTDQKIPVSLSPAGRNAPAGVSSGLVVSDARGDYGVQLRDAPGYSGSAIVNSRTGDLVGILTVLRPAGAAGVQEARLATGKSVNDVTRYAVAGFEQ